MDIGFFITCSILFLIMILIMILDKRAGGGLDCSDCEFHSSGSDRCAGHPIGIKDEDREICILFCPMEKGVDGGR